VKVSLFTNTAHQSPVLYLVRRLRGQASLQRVLCSIAGVGLPAMAAVQVWKYLLTAPAPSRAPLTLLERGLPANAVVSHQPCFWP